MRLVGLLTIQSRLPFHKPFLSAYFVLPNLWWGRLTFPEGIGYALWPLGCQHYHHHHHHLSAH